VTIAPNKRPPGNGRPFVFGSNKAIAWGVVLASRGDEMEDNGGHDACPNGNDCARPLIREDAKGEQR
jgi:hypothetical protein